MDESVTEKTSQCITSQCISFLGNRKIAYGSYVEVAVETKAFIDAGALEPVLVFDDVSSHPVEFDLRGSVDDVRVRVAALVQQEGVGSSFDLPLVGAPAAKSAHRHRSNAGDMEPGAEGEKAAGKARAGRPKLGVVAREVTLLPRHWEWLNGQPGGASVAIRKLVEEARRTKYGADQLRANRESAYRFMSAMAGNLPGFEEAARALFANNTDQFQFHIAAWPVDVRDHLEKLARRCQNTAVADSR